MGLDTRSVSTVLGSDAQTFLMLKRQHLLPFSSYSEL